MNTRTLLLAAALAVACLALSAQARDLQQVGDEAQELIDAQVAAQEKKIKQYRQQEQEHNDQQEEIAASGGRKGRGKKGRGSASDDTSDDASDASNNYDSGSDSGSGSGSDGSNQFYGRDPSDLSKAEKRKARRQAKKLGMSLDEYLGWQGGDDGASYTEEAPSKKGRKGRRSGPADDSTDSTDVPVTKGRRSGRGGGKRATYHFYGPAYETSQLYCADAFRGKESGLLGRPWTAWCVGAMKQSYCGRCVRITNLATGDSVEATVVDACGFGGVDMDPKGFNAIDGDGAGVRDGHMSVEVEWC